MNKYCHSLLLILSTIILNAQQKYIVSGTIIDEKTKTSLPFVNVYLEGTTIGTQTDVNGKFTLTKIPVGKNRLVASMVGYLPYIQVLAGNSTDFTIDISLKDDIRYLSEVKVTARRDKEWERNMKTFEKEFLGEDFNKKLVKITNREIVNFTKTDKILVATANKPLIIENNLLGYRYHFILENFEFGANKLAYKGLGRYELLDTTVLKKNLKYKKNRANAYQGSLKHFLKAVLNGNLAEAGYQCKYLNMEGVKKTTITRTSNTIKETTEEIQYEFIPKNSLFATETEKQYLLILDCPLRIEYGDFFNKQVSVIKQIGNIIVSSNGDLLDPYSLQITYGGLSDRRIAKSLPFDYEISDSQLFNLNSLDISNLPEIIKSSIQHHREKIEILTIETYYLAGETIELEAKVRDLSTKVPSDISKTLYVDLIDLNKGKLIKHYILRLDKGFKNFNIPIDNLTATGNYQIRAYTNWMRNFSEKGFFKQNFTIFSQKYRSEMTDLPKVNFDSTHIFVEGQNLVEGLRSKVAVKTLDNFGQQISSQFKLLSNKNDTLIVGETDSTGLAIVEIQPKSGENYHVLINDKKYFLPLPSKIGTVLTVDNLNSFEKLKIFIQNKGIDNEQDSLTIAVVREGQILAWKSILNNKATLTLNIQKENLVGQSQVYLLDKKGDIIAERQILIEENVEFEEIVKNDRALICEQTKAFLQVNKNLPFLDEKGISIRGQIKKMNGKENKKPVTISLVLSSLETDSLKMIKQTHTYEVTNNFEFADLEFYGQKQATFIAPENRVIVDTTTNIPLINIQKQPINWHLVENPKDMADMERRKDELFEASLKGAKRETNLEEVKVIAKKIDLLAVEGISPSYVMPEKQIINMPFLNSIIDILRNPRIKRFGNVKVFVDNLKLSEDDVKNINDLISPASVENIIIFEDAVPFQYGNTPCAIVIKLRRGAMKGLDKKNEAVIVRGYDN